MFFSATIAAAVLAFIPPTLANKVLNDANGKQVIINNHCDYDLYMQIVPGGKQTWPDQPANDTGTVPVKSGATVYTPYIWTDDDCTSTGASGPTCPGVAYKISKDPNSSFENDIIHFEYGIHTDTWSNNPALMGKQLLWYDLSLVNCAANSADIVCNGYNVNRCPGYEKGWALYFDNPDSKCTPYACNANANIEQCKYNAYFWSAPSAFGAQPANTDPNNMCQTANAYKNGNLVFDMCKDSYPSNAGPSISVTTGTSTNTCMSTMVNGGTYVTGSSTVLGNTAQYTWASGNTGAPAGATTTTATPPNGATTTTSMPTTTPTTTTTTQPNIAQTTAYTYPAGQWVATTTSTSTVTEWNGRPIPAKREVQFKA